MLKQEIKNLIEKTLKELQKEKKLPEFQIPEFSVARPERKEHGDYSANIAMALAKELKQSSMETADLLKSEILNSKSETSSKIKLFEKIETVNPGFINFFISKEFLQAQIKDILKKKEKFGQLKIGKGEKTNLEFISANPTGPLHIGNARGSFCGDVLANVLIKAGYKASREYYVNDMGRQILFLENSLRGLEPSYRNQYIDDLKARGVKDVEKAVEYIVVQIEKTIKRMGIKFDRWPYERGLEKERKWVMNFLEKKDLIYEKEGAIWFKSAELGDDKDRVLIRARDKTTYEEETYFLSDIAYLKNKFKRGFKSLIIFLGAEHHGYIGRLKAAAKALGYEPSRVKPIIMQLVKLVENGKEVKMSKRTGTFVSVDELLDEIILDVARFFFLTKSYGSHLLFDLDLAKEQSEKNPVYYIQYAHARICAILRKCDKSETRNPKSESLKLLNHQSELNLIKELIGLPEIIEDIAKDYQVHRLPQYAMDLAKSFHLFYRDCRVISENNSLTEARLNLVLAAKIVLKNTLDLMGIQAPERM